MANLLTPPAMRTASFSPFIPNLITNVGIMSSANVINLPGTITYVENLAERLKRLRKSQKMSQAKLASKAGVSQSAVGMIESGVRQNPQILVPLAAALGVSVELLATGKGLDEQRVVMSDHEAGLIDQWALLSPPQQLAVMGIIQQHVENNQEVLAAFGGAKHKAPKHDPQIIDPTLPDFNEFTDYKDQRDQERRRVQAEIDSDRRYAARRKKDADETKA